MAPFTGDRVQGRGWRRTVERLRLGHRPSRPPGRPSRPEPGDARRPRGAALAVAIAFAVFLVGYALLAAPRRRAHLSIGTVGVPAGSAGV